MRRILIVKKKLELSKLVDKKIGDNDDNEKCRSTFFFFLLFLLVVCTLKSRSLGRSRRQITTREEKQRIQIKSRT